MNSPPPKPEVILTNFFAEPTVLLVPITSRADGTERIQCVEINSNNDTKFLVASVYLPSKRSHDYVDEFYDCIDQLYEIYQKYQGTHKIIIGGDLNEDLNNEKTNKKKKYVLDVIRVWLII